MVQITQICKSTRVSLLKSLILAFLVVWHLSLKALFANSGSYIAGQFAEKEGDFRNASYYYVDLISRGETEREIIQRSVIYSALSGNFEVATAISRKINDLELRDNLQKALKTLEGKEALIIQLYFVEELNIYEIAEVMDVTTGRVSQIKTSAIRRIRDQLKKDN